MGQAEEFFHRLETLPIQPDSFADVLEAARIKARFPISYAVFARWPSVSHGQNDARSPR